MNRVLAALVVAASCAGCILFAPDDVEVGTSCSFRGEDTECGKCLVAECAAEIAGACDDEAVLVPLEQCAADATAACAQLPTSATAACLASRCATVCYEKTGTSRTSCSDAFLASRLACSCQATDTAPNDTRCSADLYPRTRCCAPFAWPSPALECACKAFACFPQSNGCICVLSENLNGSEEQRCEHGDGGHCCTTEDRCSCHPRACAVGEREVDSCTKDAVTCPVGQREVAACSIRR